MTAPGIQTIYSGRSTNWPALWLSAGLVVPLVAMGAMSGGAWTSAGFIVPLAIIVVALAVTVVTSTSVRALAGSHGVTVYFGVFGWPRFRYPLERIAHAEAVVIPASQWAWGMYWSPRKGLMLTLRTGPALRLTLTNGRLVTISTPDPDGAVRVLAAVRNAALMSRGSSHRVELRELTDANRDAVLALRLAPGQDQFVSSVAESLEEAEEHPEGSPWYRAVYVGDDPVGFVMLSWDCVPRPPDVIGPWFLWKLLIDESHQRHGYGRDVVRLVADLVHQAGAEVLFTSHVAGIDGGPGGFYERLGFVPTGELDPAGEIILRLDLPASDPAPGGGRSPRP